MGISLNLKKSLFVPKFYPLLLDYSHRWEVYMGSAGSGKSYFIAEKLIIRACNEPIRILVCRRYGNTLRNSCFSLFKEILTKWKIIQYVNIRETDMNIRFPNGSEILFFGLDDEHKLLSLNNISCIWCEEVFQIEKDKVEQLNLRMRGAAANQQIIMSFNPVSKSSWLFDFCEINPPESFTYSHSTYKDNPFLPDEYVKALDEMETRNPDKYRIFGRGEWGVEAAGKVFKNYRCEEFDAMALAASGLEHRAGMDLGWVDASAILDTLYDKENKTIYVFNEFYKSGCQVSELAAAIKDMKLTKTRLYVDAAEPRTIQYFRNEGINAVAAQKGKDSVRAGYQFLQDNLIIVHPSCQNLLRDLDELTYAKSKITGEYTDDFSNHSHTHTCDSLRYAYSDIYTNRQIKVIDFSL